MKIFSISFFLLMFYAATSGLQAQGLEQKVLLTLLEGETILFGKNCFHLSPAGADIHMVTMQEGKYYIYNNQERSGPFGQLTGEMIKTCDDDETEIMDCHVESGQLDPTSYIRAGEQGYTIEFDDKSSGPYAQVIQLAASPDKRVLFALVTTAGGKSLLICTDGRKVEMPGTVGKLCICPSGTSAFALSVGSLNMADPANMEKFSSNPTEFIQEMNKLYIYDIRGRKTGPVDNGQVNNNIWYYRHAGCNWFYILDNDLYMNGNKIKEFRDYIDPKLIYVNKSGKVIAWRTPETMTLHDGTQYPLPLKVAVYEKNGNEYLSWLSLEQEKTLVYYFMPF